MLQVIKFCVIIIILYSITPKYILGIIDLTTDESEPQRTLRRAPKLNRVWRKETATKTSPPAEKPKKIINVKKKLVQTLAKKKVKEKTKMLVSFLIVVFSCKYFTFKVDCGATGTFESDKVSGADRRREIQSVGCPR